MITREAMAASPNVEKQTYLSWAFDKLFRWTPRTLVSLSAGYYALGIAYEKGLMAEIDKRAIPIIKQHVGTAGLGAAMPVFQSYSSWSVRILAGMCAGILYKRMEKLAFFIYQYLKPRFFPQPTAAQIKVEQRI